MKWINWALSLLLFSGCLSLCQAEDLSIDELRAALQRSPNPLVALRDLQPTPDPAFKHAEPTVEFSAQDSAPSERLPRAVLVVSQFCSPCLRMEKEMPDLIGGPDAPIQLIENWRANDLVKWGVVPSIVTATPVLFILDKDGKVHGLTPARGLGCSLLGYKTREEVINYLSLSEHAVDVKREVTASKSAVTATVTGGSASAESFAAVLSRHLMASSGQEVRQNYAGLFDLNVSVDESWRNFALKILKADKVSFPVAGLTLDWSGPARSFTVEKNAIRISPAVRVSVQEWVFSYSAGLDGVSFNDDLSSVTMNLTGAPDLTVHLVWK